MASILGVGIATLDIVTTVARYPAEDEELRALSRRIARGGNASNTLVVLAQLGHRCAWAGVTTRDADGERVLRDLATYGVDTRTCRQVDHGTVPTSQVVLSRATASRTIIHFRDLPEYAYADFRRLEPRDFDWLHFEGRNLAETHRMLRDVRRRHPSARVSLEVEKPREGIEALFDAADVLLFSRPYARARGHTGALELLRAMARPAPRALLICAWGEDGAYARTPAGDECHAPASAPGAVVDTLGAGDVFNAGVIHGLLQGRPVEPMLLAATTLAGRKCTREGLDLRA